MTRIKRRYRAIVSAFPTEKQWITLSADESHHLINVLRLTAGETVEALNLKGQSMLVALDHPIKKSEPYRVRWIENPTSRDSHPQETVPVTLFLSVLKGDAMEWIIEKSTELGISKIIPMQTERTVLDLKKKGLQYHQERWQKVSDQSLKQCERLKQMDVHLPLSWEEALQRVDSQNNSTHWAADEDMLTATHPPLGSMLRQRDLKSVSLWIGPEGGWSPREQTAFQQLGMTRFGLGPLVLRAETASVCAASIAGDFFRGRFFSAKPLG